MGTLDSNGIYMYDSTDKIAPIHTAFNLGMSSVSDALEKSNDVLFNEYSIFKRVNNIAERNAYAQQRADEGFPGSPDNRLYVIMGSNGNIQEYDGTTWRTMWSADNGMRYVLGSSEITTDYAALPGPIVHNAKRRDSGDVFYGTTFSSKPFVIVGGAIYTSGHVISTAAVDIHQDRFKIRISVPSGTPRETRWFYWAAFGRVA